MTFFNFSRGLALTFAIGICASFAAAAAQERWATYTNPRFGTIADYPADIFTVRDPPPENGDGQSFHSSDGRAQLSIYGKHNAEGDTPQSYLEKYVDLQGVSYRRTMERFYVISGTREGDIFYERCNFPENRDGIIDCVGVSYPAREKLAWNPIVKRLSKSLRAGRGIEPRQ
jgi:hypothetical protein